MRRERSRRVQHSNIGISLPAPSKSPRPRVLCGRAAHDTLKGDRIVASSNRYPESLRCTHYAI